MFRLYFLAELGRPEVDPWSTLGRTQVPEPTRPQVDPESTPSGQPWIDLGSTWCRPGVDLGVDHGSTWG